jgi:hypothetical protein
MHKVLTCTGRVYRYTWMLDDGCTSRARHSPTKPKTSGKPNLKRAGTTSTRTQRKIKLKQKIAGPWEILG